MSSQYIWTPGDLTKAEIVADPNLNKVNRNRALHNQSKKAIKTAETYVAGNESSWGSNVPNSQDQALDILAAAVQPSAGNNVKSALLSWSKNLGQGTLSLPANAIVTRVIADVQTTVTVATDYKLTVGASDITATGNTLAAGQYNVSAAAPVKSVAGGAVSVAFTGVPGAGKIQFMVEYYVSPAVA